MGIFSQYQNLLESETTDKIKNTISKNKGKIGIGAGLAAGVGGAGYAAHSAFAGLDDEAKQHVAKKLTYSQELSKQAHQLYSDKTQASQDSPLYGEHLHAMGKSVGDALHNLHPAIAPAAAGVMTGALGYMFHKDYQKRKAASGK